MEIALVLFVIAVIFIIQTLKVVPQQHAWVVERLGKYHATLTPGLNFLVPRPRESRTRLHSRTGGRRSKSGAAAIASSTTAQAPSSSPSS